MRLKTKLVLWLTALMFAIVLLLSSLFVGELLRQRIEQTAATNDVLAHEVVLTTRTAVETGLRAHPPTEMSDAALRLAVRDALRSQDALLELMNAIVRYSPTVQDVSVSDAFGVTIISTDPDAVDKPFPYCACGRAVDVFEELVSAVAAGSAEVCPAGGAGFDGGCWRGGEYSTATDSTDQQSARSIDACRRRGRAGEAGVQ